MVVISVLGLFLFSIVSESDSDVISVDSFFNEFPNGSLEKASSSEKLPEVEAISSLYFPSVENGLFSVLSSYVLFSESIIFEPEPNIFSFTSFIFVVNSVVSLLASIDLLLYLIEIDSEIISVAEPNSFSP